MSLRPEKVINQIVFRHCGIYLMSVKMLQIVPKRNPSGDKRQFFPTYKLWPGREEWLHVSPD